MKVSGFDVDDYPTMKLDPTDVGLRVTQVTVASPLPLSFVHARYTVRFDDDPFPRLTNGSHAEAVAQLRRSADDATFSLTYHLPGSVFAPGHPDTLFVLAAPLVRRLAVLEAAFAWVDPLGRHVTKVVPAVAKQPLNRPVRAEERIP